MPRYEKSEIKKGMFLTSTPAPPGYMVRQSLPDDSDAGADRLAVVNYRHAIAVAAIAERLEAVRKSLDDIKTRKSR